jgi:hypothetical protein
MNAISKVDTRAINRARAAARRAEPRVRQALLDAIAALKKGVDLNLLAAALEGGRIDEALRILNVPRLEAILSGQGITAENFRESLTATYAAGAATALEVLPPAIRLQASFDLLNPRATEFLRRYEFNLIRQMTVDTQRAIGGVVLRGFNEGLPPNVQARHIREMIGLTDSQARAVDNFRRQLRTQELQGKQVLPWERKLSAPERAQARRIFNDGGTTAEIEALTAKYRQRLVNLRARTIARTETIRASAEGQQEMWRQAADQGFLDPAKTRRMWIVTRDDRLSEHDRQIPGLNPDGVALDQAFRTPSGILMNPPTRPNCRCAVVLDFLEEPAAP